MVPLQPMDENPYKAPQARCLPLRTIGKLLPLLLPVFFALLAYALFGMVWQTPPPVIAR